MIEESVSGNELAVSRDVASLRGAVSGTPLATLVASYVAELGDELTGRELEITVLLVRGYSAKEIAQSIEVSPCTVRTHMKNLYPKLDVTSQARLCARFFDFVFAEFQRGTNFPLRHRRAVLAHQE
jgi:DNA-binding NarL/FixJ family response regulator